MIIINYYVFLFIVEKCYQKWLNSLKFRFLFNLYLYNYDFA